MKTAEILSVGEELLLGDVVDTNATWLARALKEVGFVLSFRQTCGDTEEHIRFSLELALSRSDLVLVTGGLGPTYDDITRQVAAKVFGAELKEDPEVAETLRSYFHRRGMEMPKSNLLQALVPEGAQVLRNDWGTAPGLWLQGDVGSAILLPGVPSEMKAIFENRVLPSLRASANSCMETVVLHFYGIAESLLDEKLKDLTVPGSDPVIAPYAGGGEVELHITSSGEDRKTALEKCEFAKKEILSRVGEFCYGEGDINLERALVEACIDKNLTLATAESCTGGLLSQRITSVEGASRVFRLGICTYSEEEKKKRLGVSEEILSVYGVYSKECALAMARGVRSLSGADIGIGITGIAGPGGGTDRDPVGTVYLSVVSKEKEETVRAVFGTVGAKRDFIRLLASSKALAMALSQGKKSVSP